MHEALRILRIDLGHFLLLGLELLIVSDILHSIVKRSMEEIAILAVTVLIRISLSYFLNKEIAELSQSEDPT